MRVSANPQARRSAHVEGGLEAGQRLLAAGLYEVAAAAARLEQARAQLQLARLTLDRLRPSVDTGAASREDLDRAEQPEAQTAVRGSGACGHALHPQSTQPPTAGSGCMDNLKANARLRDVVGKIVSPQSSGWASPFA